jgi:GNAT superfamily N-acetyltransferase
MKKNEKKETVEIVSLNPDNIESEDIVCVRGEKNSEGINNKKEWLKKRFKEGLKFKILKINGRSWGMIEYLPAENGWRPIEAPGYMLINCMWVIGRYKGKGYGSMLLDECIKDSKKMNGIVLLTSNCWTPKKGFFIKKGFEVCDSVPENDKSPVFELLVKKFKKSPNPQFFKNAKSGEIKNSKGLKFFHTDQCPYVIQHMTNTMKLAEIYNVPIEKIKYTSKEQARKSFCAYNSYSVFFDGKFISHDLNPKVFAKKMSELIDD